MHRFSGLITPDSVQGSVRCGARRGVAEVSDAMRGGAEPGTYSLKGCPVDISSTLGVSFRRCVGVAVVLVHPEPKRERNCAHLHDSRVRDELHG